MQQKERIRVYTWEFPVRLTHWINALSVLSLSVTGFYIGKPFMHAVSSSEYIMGWMRFIHFVSAYALLMSVAVRIYWAFAGNSYASWRAWLPLTGRQWRNLVGTLKFYLFMSRKPPRTIGHTALAGLVYLFVFGLFVFEIVSGFALYSLTHQGVLWTALGGWLTGVMHLQTIRLYHHLAMYVIAVFVAAHVYIAWYLDLTERSGLVGSIFSGDKFVTDREWE